MAEQGRKAGYRHTDEAREAIAAGQRRAQARKRGDDDAAPVPDDHAWCSGHQRYEPISGFGKNKSRAAGIQSSCKVWFNDYYASKREHHIRANQDDTVRRVYGLTLDEVEARIEAQGNTCAICHGPPNGNGRLHVDHSHVTGQNRAMLDFTCNSNLGRVEKWIESGWLIDAVKYLVEWGSLTDEEVQSLAAALH